MKFIVGLFKVLRDTAWPSRKQSWKDYISILEYTAFFTLIIFVFDHLIKTGLLELFTRF